MNRRKENTSFLFALVWAASPAWERGVVPATAIRQEKETRASQLLLKSPAPAGKLDLPPVKPAPALMPGLANLKDSGRAYSEYEALTDEIGIWSDRYMDKKWVEERLQSGRTLPGPLFQQKDAQLYLLFPVDIDNRLLNARPVPIGALFRFQMFGTKPQKSNPTFAPSEKSN